MLFFFAHSGYGLKPDAVARYHLAAQIDGSADLLAVVVVPDRNDAGTGGLSTKLTRLSGSETDQASMRPFWRRDQDRRGSCETLHFIF
jgi:hypothetical protein